MSKIGDFIRRHNPFRHKADNGGGAQVDNNQGGQVNTKDSVGSAVKIDPGTYKNLLDSLQQVQKAQKISDRPSLDLDNRRIGCEIEVAAPSNVDDVSGPPSKQDVQHLMDCGYKFYFDASIVKDNGVEKIADGKQCTDAAAIIEYADKNPNGLVAEDPHTGKPAPFNDTPNPKTNTQLFWRYVKFKTFLQDQVRPAFDKMGWIVEDTTDCQAHADVQEVIRYVEVKNDALGHPEKATVNGGIKNDVKQALAILKGLGCTPHDACALQYHVDMTNVPRAEAVRTMQNLAKLELENENIMYRAAQNGNDHSRGVSNNFSFMQSLANEPVTPLLHAETPKQWFDSWYGTLFPGGGVDDPKEAPPQMDQNGDVKGGGPYHKSRYFGYNFHSYWYRGTIEMRHPGTTLDGDTAEAHLDAALGLVRAAYDGDSEWKGMHPLGWQRDVSDPKTFQVGNGAPVAREQMTSFLDRVFGDKPTRRTYTELFLKSGGQITDQAEDNSDKQKVADLLGKGFQFKTVVTELPQVQSFVTQDPVEIVDGTKVLRTEVEVTQPGAQNPITLHNPDELHNFLISN
jgi:hypothetical protein